MDDKQILITLIFVFCFYLFNFVTGAALLKILKMKANKALSIITGVILLFATTEIISIPFMEFKGDFNTLFILFCSIETLIFILSLYYLFIRCHDYSIIKFDFNNFTNIWVTLIIISVLIQTAVPTFFSRFDGDDAFYIAISTSIQTTGKIFLNNPSIGLDKFPFPTNYSFTSFEILITIFSQIINFKPVIVYHSILPFTIIPLSYVANWALGIAFFPDDRKKVSYFVLIIAILTFFNGFTGCLPNSLVLLRPWMGKSVMVSSLFPAFMAYFIYFFRDYNKTSYFFLFGLSLIAAACASSTGLYLLPIWYFLLFISFLIVKRVSLKENIALLIKAFISVIPILIILVWFFLNLKNGNQLEIISDFESDKNWLGELDYIVNSNWTFLIIFILSFLYFVFLGNKLEKLLFVVQPVLLLLTFLNPLLHEFVGLHITSLSTYWRLFWLIPYYPCLALFVISAYKEIDVNRLKWLSLLPLLSLCNPFFFSLSDAKYGGVENASKVPEDVYQAISTIKEHVNTEDPNDLYLLALPQYNIFVRQCTGDIALVMPRLNYVKEAFISINKDDDFNYIKNLYTFNKDEIIQGYVDKFNVNDINKAGISLVIAPEEREELKKEFESVELSNRDILYIKKGIYKK